MAGRCPHICVIQGIFLVGARNFIVGEENRGHPRAYGPAGAMQMEAAARLKRAIARRACVGWRPRGGGIQTCMSATRRNRTNQKRQRFGWQRGCRISAMMQMCTICFGIRHVWIRALARDMVCTCTNTPPRKGPHFVIWIP